MNEKEMTLNRLARVQTGCLGACKSSATDDSQPLTDNVFNYATSAMTFCYVINISDVWTEK